MVKSSVDEWVENQQKNAPNGHVLNEQLGIKQ